MVDDFGRGELQNMLSGFSNQMENHLDRQAAARGRREGALAGADGSADMVDDGTIYGGAYNNAARAAVGLHIETDARLRMDEFESAHSMDAGSFEAKANGYFNGVLENLNKQDPEAANRLSSSLELRKRDAIRRIGERSTAALRDQQLEGGLKQYDALNKDLHDRTARLVEAGDGDIEGLLNGVMQDASQMKQVSHMRGPDGQYLFNARQRAQMDRESTELFEDQVGLAWLRRNDNPQAAMDAMREGTAAIQYTNETGDVQTLKLNQMIGVEAGARVRKKYIDDLRAQYALDAQVEAREEKEFQEGSDKLFVDFSVMAQEGQLKLDVVDAVRPFLDEDHYLTLREVARGGGATVSDGSVFAALSVEDANGVDIRGRLQAEYKRGALSTQDYLSLYGGNTKRLSGGLADPVTAGRDYLKRSLGVLSKELDYAQAVRIGPAMSDYDILMEDFTVKNKRLPTRREANDMARKIVDEYALDDFKEAMGGKSTPLYKRGGLNAVGVKTLEEIKAQGEKVADKFMKKHENNEAAVKADPEYVRAMGELEDAARKYNAVSGVVGNGQ